MVFEKVRDMIASQLQVAPESITMESRLVEDLKADSANVMVMILEMETEFGMEVEVDAVVLADEFTGDILDGLAGHKGQREPGHIGPQVVESAALCRVEEEAVPLLRGVIGKAGLDGMEGTQKGHVLP